VKFHLGDAYDPSYQPANFDGALSTFWLSHILKAKLEEWIDTLHRLLKPAFQVFIVDNTNIQGIGGPVITKNGDENTYKLRTLRDGSQHTIRKNYYLIKELIHLFGRHTKNFGEENVYHGHYIYWVNYSL
jgi:hypothetical protein